MADRTCSVDGCERPRASRGLCGAHAYRLKNGLDLAPPVRDVPRGPLADRLWAKVHKTETCWLWTGTTDRDGYGYLGKGGAGGGSVRAHRAAYELLVGTIPAGWVIDHLCRVRNCVNPAHLEAVTPQENQWRSHGAITHCRRAGHEYTPDNTRLDTRGRRCCRACAAEKWASRAARKRAQP